MRAVLYSNFPTQLYFACGKFINTVERLLSELTGTSDSSDNRT